VSAPSKKWIRSASRTYALPLVLEYSRYLRAGFSFGLALPELLRCLGEALAFLGGVPKRLLFDNRRAQPGYGGYTEHIRRLADHPPAHVHSAKQWAT
jgi:transposase